MGRPPLPAFPARSDVWSDAAGEQRIPPWEEIQRLPGVHLHLYGKQDVKRGRKMGHVTITAASVDMLQDKAAQVAQILGLPYERLQVAA